MNADGTLTGVAGFYALRGTFEPGPAHRIQAEMKEGDFIILPDETLRIKDGELVTEATA